MAFAEKFTLSKHERLRDQKHIKLLLTKGSVLRLYPLKIFYIKKKQEGAPLTHKVLFLVPKYNIASAIQRNRIKRLLREAYRLNKHSLYTASANAKFAFLIGYMYTEKVRGVHYSVVNKAMLTSLQYLTTLVIGGSYKSLC